MSAGQFFSAPEGSLLAAAHELRRWGFRLFPLHYVVDHSGRLWCSCGNRDCKNAAKHPYSRHAPQGLLNSSKDPHQLEEWWGAGTPYNIGVRTGEASGVVAVDVDPRHGGDEALAVLERRFGGLPPTWRFLTGGGGMHVLFKHPGRRLQNSTSQVGAGIDVRGDGGYIVGPGSRHISGRYYAISVDHHPDEVELAELPPWLMTLMADPAKPNGSGTAALPESWRKLVAEGVAEGRRNEAIVRLTGHLLRKDVDPLVVLDLVKCWNLKRCRPPLDDAEIVTTVNSIAARELGRRGASHG